MTSLDNGAPKGQTASVLNPYTPDHAKGAYLWGRGLIFSGLVIFCLLYGMAFALFAPFLILGFLIPPAILALVVLWSLPDLRKVPTESLWGLIFAFMVCMIMWPNYIALALPGLPWITMVRLTGFPLAFILLLCVSTSPLFRSQLKDVLRTVPYVWKLLVAFIVIQCASLAFSDRPLFSIDRFLIDQVSWTAIFFVSAYVFIKPGRVETMAALIWVMALGVGAIAVFEWRTHHVPWAGHIPNFLQIADPSVQRALALEDRGDGALRVKSTFATSIGLGEYMALSMPFVLRFAIGDYKWPIRSAAIASCIFVMFIAWISGSRCGKMGVPIAALLYGAAWAVLKWRREPSSLLGPAVALAYPVVSVFAISAVLFIGRLHQIFIGNGSEVSSTDDRVEQWQLGIPKVLSHPWGYGVGRAADILGFNPYGVKTIDNYYLAITLDYGIVGFFIYYSIFAAAIFYCLKSAFTVELKSRDLQFILPVCISLFIFILIKSSFSEEGNHPLVFMMLGMVAAMMYRIPSTNKAVVGVVAGEKPQAFNHVAGHVGRSSALSRSSLVSGASGKM